MGFLIGRTGDICNARGPRVMYRLIVVVLEEDISCRTVAIA
jgi:hypothetical protein